VVVAMGLTLSALGCGIDNAKSVSVPVPRALRCLAIPTEAEAITPQNRLANLKALLSRPKE
jgi:hypothetical protein